jgi:hypothetical protein
MKETIGGSEVWYSSKRLGINHPSKKEHNKHSRRSAGWFLCVCVCVGVCGVCAPYFPVSFLGLSSSPFFFFFYIFVSLEKVQVLAAAVSRRQVSTTARVPPTLLITGAAVGSNIFWFVLLQIGYMELFLLQRCAA